eukprot:scaffold43776_cov50-Phaeocystis_antarctica.AAC.1
MSEEQRAGELAATHQHMRSRPLKRAESAARSRQFRTQIGACFWNHIGSVGLYRREGTVWSSNGPLTRSARGPRLWAWSLGYASRKPLLNAFERLVFPTA